MEIIKHIEYLLMDNDCVVVPDFGAFICHEESAVCADGEFCPPVRKVSFNGALTHNDALLANSLMREKGCSYSVAVSMIEDDVDALKQRLIDDKSVAFGTIGKISYSDTGCMVFEPSVGYAACNMANFGLPTVRIENAKPSDVTEEAKGISLAQLRKNVIRIAASVAVIIVMALTLTTPISIDSAPDKASVATIATVKPVAEKAVVAKENIDSKSVEKQPVASVVKSEVDVAVSRERYSIVIASLRSHKQAEKYIEASGEKGLTIIDAQQGSSVYKVALASGDSRQEMERMIESQRIAERYPDVWVCKN